MPVDDVIHADTRRLREHRDIVLYERQLARHLSEEIRLAMRKADSADAWEYETLLRNADTLEQYFREMADLIGQLSEDLERSSHHFGARLEENLNWTDRIFTSD